MVKSRFTAAPKRDGDKETFIGRVSKDEQRKGARSHQVDVEHGAVVAIDVRVHGALLRCQTDSAVLQGERGVGRHLVPEAQKRDFNELVLKSAVGWCSCAKHSWKM